MSKPTPDVRKLDPKQDGQSLDLVRENIAALKSLFPEIVSDGKVDFEVLRTLLGDQVDVGDERYGLNWLGKQRARLIAQQPSTGTLRPCPEESVNWDTTQNLFIEGDNLEVLKLLQKAYHRRIKMIYIDPPYNTGKEFIYPDKYQDNLDTYLRYTGQKGEDGLKVGVNVETGGRYHTNWLNMMYPRLKLARNLLRDDGVIFVSIDDHEVQNLRALMDEVFGPENLISTLVWKSRQNKDNRSVTSVSVDHEYVVVYGRSLKGALRDMAKYGNPDLDPRGDWTSANMVGLAPIDRRPNLHYDLINPINGINYGCPPMGWRYERATMGRLIAEDKVLWPAEASGRPRRKSFLSELKATSTGYSSIICHNIYTRHGTAEIDELFGKRVFDFPKPTELIAELLEQGRSENDVDIVLDFFAGSATTGHAVMNQGEGGASARFLLVQLPERLDPENPNQKLGHDWCLEHGLSPTVAELSKERLRRAAERVGGNLSAGFKVFKLDSSNLKAWDGAPERFTNRTLDDAVDHIKPGRTNDDLLYELLLKLGLDLASPIERRDIQGAEVQVIGVGALVVCLQPNLALEVIDGIAALKAELTPEVMRVVFRDACFADDVTKANAVQILRHAGVDDIQSL